MLLKLNREHLVILNHLNAFIFKTISSVMSLLRKEKVCIFFFQICTDKETVHYFFYIMNHHFW